MSDADFRDLVRRMRVVQRRPTLTTRDLDEVRHLELLVDDELRKDVPPPTLFDATEGDSNA